MIMYYDRNAEELNTLDELETLYTFFHEDDPRTFSEFMKEALASGDLSEVEYKEITVINPDDGLEETIRISPVAYRFNPSDSPRPGTLLEVKHIIWWTASGVIEKPFSEVTAKDIDKNNVRYIQGYYNPLGVEIY